MSSTIDIGDLRVGMFIHLDGGWLSHPFPLSSFRVSSTEQIATLRGLGLAQVRWSPEKSDRPEEAAEAKLQAAMVMPSEAELQSTARLAAMAEQRDSMRRCERQLGEAAKAWRESHDAVAARPLDAGRGAEALAQAMTDKMLVAGDINIRLISGSGDDLFDTV